MLITGGKPLTRPFGPTPQPLASAEIWDPRTDHWTDVSPLRFPRFEHDAVLLADGRVLVAGDIFSRSEIWDPATGGWTTTTPFTQTIGAKVHLAALPDGRVLAVGTLGVQLWTP